MEHEHLNNKIDIFQYTPRLFMEDIRKLVKELSQEHFDAILAVARGGLIPAGILSNRLNIARIHMLQIKSYCDQTQGHIEILQEPVWSQMVGRRILVVDDLIDEGKTIECVVQLLQSQNITAYKIVVLIDKQKTARVVPDYYCRVIKDWVAFFWEDTYLEENP
jgi:hypoxanthine phosphoribosyltransferase